MPAETVRNWLIMAENALKTLADIQSMIDILLDKLVALRDLRLQEFIKEEIRSLEGKLLKHFRQQLAAKALIPKAHWLTDFKSYPSLSQWLSVVGISNGVKEKLVGRVHSMESLLALSDDDTVSLLSGCGGDTEDERKLATALCLLKDKEADARLKTDSIYWDSWTKSDNSKDILDSEAAYSVSDFDHNENLHVTRQEESKRPSQVCGSNGHEIVVHTASGRTVTPEWCHPTNFDEASCNRTHTSSHCSKSSLSSADPPSPVISKQGNDDCHQDHGLVGSAVGNAHGHSNLWNASSCIMQNHEDALRNLSASGLNSFGPIRPARSYEWQIGRHITSRDDSMTDSNLSLTSITTLPPAPSSNSSGPKLFSARKRMKKRPGNIVIQRENPPDLIDLLRPSTGGSRRMSQTTAANSDGHPVSSCGSPVSPRTPMTPGTPVINDFINNHHESSSSVIPQTPKTPSRFKGGLRAIKDKIKDKIGRSKLRRNKSEERVADESGDTLHHKTRSETCPSINVSGVSQKQDSNEKRTLELQNNSAHSSNSSISSSQFVRMHASSSFDIGLLSSGKTAPGEAYLLSDKDSFGFESTPSMHKGHNPGFLEGAEENCTAAATSENSADGNNSSARANLMRQSSTMSNVLEEWDIPWDDLVLQERIGQGRVGSVYRGKWHGEVAIRVIDICHSDEFKLRAFKNEMMLYKKTRHDNVELFMGSCMNPPRLAIITGYCRGKSLYHYIRSSKDPVNLNVAKIISQHVAQGMGYLHSRGIIHKDLKSKNIFLDGKRVTITDFGLMGLHAISTKSMQIKPETLQVPDGWLCYMAPEVIRALKVPIDNTDVVSSLPYTKESDVFAFGTIWYELLTGCWPFNDYPCESVIWQVGNGKKQSLAHLQGPKELKDILMGCWCYDPAQRPDFSDAGIMGQLLNLPQAKIIRRSSQPIKGNKKGGRLTGAGHERFFDPNFPSVLHELAEGDLQ